MSIKPWSFSRIKAFEQCPKQFYHEKKFSKSRQWLDLVQDEFRRDELRMKLEYFNVG